MTENSPVLQADSIRKTFAQAGGPAHVALAGANLCLQGGRMTALLGRSGSGKSTLLSILGLLSKADSGRLTVVGEEVTDLSRSRLAALRRRHIGFVFQSYALVQQLTALENVELAQLAGARRADRAFCLTLLDRFGLKDRANNPVTTLSGGEQQRVAICRSIVNDPAVVLADEPTGNLDSSSAESVMSELRALANEGRALLIVTHDEVVAQRCDHVIRLEDGVLSSDIERAPQAGKENLR